MTTPESKLAELRASARRAETAYQQSLALIESRKEAAVAAISDLKALGVTSLSEAQTLIDQLTQEIEDALEEARKLVQG